MPRAPQQFDTLSLTVPVPGGRTWGQERGFDTSALPDGVPWRTLHNPGRSRPYVSAAIPARKVRRDGTVVDAGTTGLDGVSIVIGPWGQESVEHATVQVSSKALHGGSNVEPMRGSQDVDRALGIVLPLVRALGYRGDPRDAIVARFDSVVQFDGVEQHGRYVASFADNKPAVRGGRHVMHGAQTLAQHFEGGMSRLYDKHAETASPAALGISRYEYERKRARLKRVGVTTVRDLDLVRLDREARKMFEDSGYDREVAPVSDWVWKVLTAVPRYPLCDFCADTLDDDVREVSFDVDMAAEMDGWGPAFMDRRRFSACQDPDRCGEPLPGFGTAARRGALAHAILERIGVDPQTHRNTLSKYRKLFEVAGVQPETVELLEDEAGGEVVFLDLHSQEERRKSTPERFLA